MGSVVERLCEQIINAIGHKDADLFSGACLVRPFYQVDVSDSLMQEMLEDE